jgi:hypothetical protein
MLPTITLKLKIQEKDIKNKFLNSLILGTGETYLILKENPKIDFSSIIVKGAINNYAYDSQSEGSRAKYIYGLIKKSKQREKIIQKLLTRLINLKEDDWGLYQLCDLVTYLHKDGYSDARKHLNIRYDKNKLDEYDDCGYEQLIEIDGINGILKVAEYVGEILLNDKDEYEDSWIIDEFQKKNKEINVYEVLKQNGKENKYIQSYYDTIIKNKFKPYKRIKKVKFSYELIKAKIKNDKFIFISKERANDLTTQEVEKLANDFLNSKIRREQELYLTFFTTRKFPFDYAPLLKIAKGKISKKTRIVEFAVETLAFFENPEIRSFAIEKIKTTKNPCDYLPLLISNYQKGDYILLNEVISRSNNFDFIHSLITSILDIYKENKTKECKEPLVAMYNKMNCGLHRVDIIEILIENDILDDKIFNEMKYDCDDEIKKLYRKINKNGR